MKQIIMLLHKAYFFAWIFSQSEEILNYMDLKKFYFTLSLTVASTSLYYGHVLLLLHALLEQRSISEADVCTNNNLKEKLIIKLSVNCTSPFKNVHIVRQL